MSGIMWVIMDTNGCYLSKYRAGERPLWTHDPDEAYVYHSIEYSSADCVRLFHAGHKVAVVPIEAQ